jgi:dienelactone hydrolase
MKTVKTFLILLLINQTYSAGANNSPDAFVEPDNQSILSQWFSIDSQFDIKMQKTLSTNSVANDKSEKYSLSFTSDDQKLVNGTLAIPKSFKGKPKLALLLHAMGTDENLWWSESMISGSKISNKLIENGYSVLTLDARRHGKRVIDELTAKDMIAKAHSGEPRLYTDMIIGTVRDYRLALNWAKKELKLDQTSFMVVGYSMGAQMSLLLASYETDINQVMVMVPPFVSELQSPVAPRLHVSRINKADLLYLAAKQDPYSSAENTQVVFDKIATKNKSIHWFESGHLLPKDYIINALSFIDSLNPINQKALLN